MNSNFTQKFFAYTAILRPTLSGVLVYILLSAGILAIHQVPNFQHYLNLPSHWSAGNELLVVLNTLLLKFLGESKVDTIILSLFWVGVGLVVYLFLKSAIGFFVDMGEDIVESKRYMQPKQNALKSQARVLAERSAFRIAVFIVIIVYLLTLGSYALHATLSSTSGLGMWLNNGGPIIKYSGLFVEEFLIWYGLTILIRLFLLRTRIFP